MDDAIESTSKGTEATKEQDHSFFKQFKRKKPADYKAPQNKNTRANVNNTNDDAMPSASTSAQEAVTPTIILGNEIGSDNEEPVVPESHLNATNYDDFTPTMTDISDEELEWHLSNLERDSINTIIHQGMNGRMNQENLGNQEPWDEREKERLVFRLDNLNDKKCRFVSHMSFLNKCLENNVIPNGLRVYVEPSIGNRNEGFLNRWHACLDEFSRKLTTEVISFCGTEISTTNKEIAEIGGRLQTLTTNTEFTKIRATIVANERSRTNELTARKNRKFYRLKYNNAE